jgi:hypothetical protein
MPEYKLYLCRPDGHFSQRLDFESSDDPAAVEQAHALLTTARGELWAGARKVCEFDTRGMAQDGPPTRPRPAPRRD